VQRDRDEVHLPRPAEVRRDHGQLRVRGRDGVQLERVRVVDPDALAAWLPGADSAGAGVEQREQAVPLAGGEHRPVLRVVGGERLQRRVELDAAKPELRYARDLVHRRRLVRVDRPEPGERVGVLQAGGGDRLVGHPGAAGGRLGVPGQQHRQHVKSAVLVRELAERLPLDG
jgi:hypothetical protein